MPSEIEKGLDLPYLSNGDQDSIAALYSNQSLSPYNGNKDMYNISVQLNPVVSNNNSTQEIKVLVPEGFRDALSIDTTTPARFCLSQN